MLSIYSDENHLNTPFGIWTWASDHVTIQFCVSHHNRSTATDGGGFDLDGGVTNSVLQYNYSHDNHGAGYLICQYEGASVFRNNTVRYNISQDEGLTNHNSGIYVWVGGSGMESTDVYNNAVFNSKGAAVAFGGDPKYALPQPGMTFRNNIFVSGEAQIEGRARNGCFEGSSLRSWPSSRKFRAGCEPARTAIGGGVLKSRIRLRGSCV